MTRLDYHVSAVRTKLTLSILLSALAWALIGFGVVVLLAILVERLLGFGLPKPMIWMWSALGATVIGAIAYAVWRRPSARDAAVAIDERLSLKEKFSTALYVRPSSDPFAMAAVKDAEATAEKVSLQNRFPVAMPFHGVFTFVTAVAVVIVGLFLPKVDLFGVEQRAKARQAQVQEEARAREVVRDALAKIDAAPPKVAEDEVVRAAKLDLERMIQQSKISDPTKAKATAQRALQEVNSIREKIKNAGQFAQAENDMKVFRSMPGPTDVSTPVGKAHDLIKKAQFTEAINNLQDAVKKFDKMDKAEQDKTAQQMKQLAQQLAAQANNPQAQQQMQKQLQQLGANQQQAQQMAKMMQQAAAGDKRAQQQLQQAANKMMQQMNNGQGPNAAQQQQVNQMMQQMQAQANGQQQAAALAQAAQQMAQAMSRGPSRGSNRASNKVSRLRTPRR